MKSKIIEVTNDGFNWGRFWLGIPDADEWGHKSAVEKGMGLDGEAHARSVLHTAGWSLLSHTFVLFDLVTCEGAAFNPGGSASADLAKHQIWVCPMYEPFLVWLYEHAPRDGESLALDEIPGLVDLGKVGGALYGYRRGGPAEQDGDAVRRP
jgi:hypothetical protein